MTLKELEIALKSVSNYNKAIYAMFKGLKDQKEYILDLNREQLFKDSIGADNVELGYYISNEENEALGKDGMPFTMVDTGLFKQGMYIEFYYRHITIRSKYHTYAMIQSNVFNTTEFFGLTDKNLGILIDRKAKPILLEWMKATISGKAPNTSSAGTV